MRLLFFIGLLLITSSCTKDSIDKISGTKLVAIQYESGDITWDEDYSYDSFERLSLVTNNRSVSTEYEISYEGGKVINILTSLNGSGSFYRDSLTYNDQNKLQEVIYYQIDFGGFESPYQTSTYSYDESGQMNQKSVYSDVNQELAFITTYVWENGNIIQEETVDNNGQFIGSVDYTYDDKENWLQFNPNYFREAPFWSTNNVTKSAYDDGNSLIDRACQTCSTDYTYNLDGYPVEVEFDWGLKMVLEYE